MACSAPRATPGGGGGPRARSLCPAARSPRSRAFLRGGRVGLERRVARCPGPGGGWAGSGPSRDPRAGRTAGGPAARSCCSSSVRVFFGKLHLFSSLVAASPERDGMSHRGTHSPGLGSRERGRRRGCRGVPGLGQLAWAEVRGLRREGEVTERSRTLVLGPGSGQRVEAGVCGCVGSSAPCPAASVILAGAGGRKRRGPFLRAPRGPPVGTVTKLKSANRCDEMVPGHPLWLLRTLGLGSGMACWRSSLGPAAFLLSASQPFA